MNLTDISHLIQLRQYLYAAVQGSSTNLKREHINPSNRIIKEIDELIVTNALALDIKNLDKKVVTFNASDVSDSDLKAYLDRCAERQANVDELKISRNAEVLKGVLEINTPTSLISAVPDQEPTKPKRKPSVRRTPAE